MVQGDLLEEPVDVIVNAANGHLAHGGGVAGIISRAAGPALQSAGRLPFKAVIHAVGPRYGEGDEERKLVKALSAALALAAERGWLSLSFPAVSAGIFSVPLDICARAYLAASRTAKLRKVRLCLRDQPVIDAVLREMKRS